MKHYSPTSRNQRRVARLTRGFTLVELLVVMGIIVILMGITAAVIGNAVGTAKEKATIANIRKIDGLLTQRMEAFTMAMKAQKYNGTSTAEVIKRKQLFRAAFPQSLSEAFGATDSATDQTASSEAMYEFLTNKESFGSQPVDADSFTSNEVADTDNDGRMEFIDGWGRPLRFYRWPTRLIRPGGYSTAATGNFGTSGYSASLFFGSLPTSELGKDPDDALGQLNATYLTNTYTGGIAGFETDYHTPETWSLPLIVSVGADNTLGLFEPVDKANFGHLAQPRTDDATELEGVLDNLSNRNMQP